MSNDMPPMQYDMMMPPMMPPQQQQVPLADVPFTIPSNDANIASMRWTSDPLINDLRRQVGGYFVGTDDSNKLVINKVSGIRPLMNYEGTERLAAIIASVVNPVTSLTYTMDDEANELIRQQLINIAKAIVINKARWEIHDKDMVVIKEVYVPLVFAQHKRGVKGHESNKFHTQRVEQSVNNTSAPSQQQGGRPAGFNFLMR